MKAGLPAKEPKIAARWEEEGLYQQLREARAAKDDLAAAARASAAARDGDAAVVRDFVAHAHHEHLRDANKLARGGLSLLAQHRALLARREWRRHLTYELLFRHRIGVCRVPSAPPRRPELVWQHVRQE